MAWQLSHFARRCRTARCDGYLLSASSTRSASARGIELAPSCDLADPLAGWLRTVYNALMRGYRYNVKQAYSAECPAEMEFQLLVIAIT